MKLLNATMVGAAGLMMSTAAVMADGPAPVVVPVIPAPVTEYDWTGFYAGLHVGGARMNDSFAIVNGRVAGLQAGYLYDSGTWVVGGEVSTSQVSQNFWFPTNYNVTDIKLRAGYGADRFLPYAVLGAGYMDFNIFTPPGDNVFIAGFGAEYAVTERVRIGGEYLHRWNNALTYGGLPPFAWTDDTVTLRINIAF